MTGRQWLGCAAAGGAVLFFALAGYTCLNGCTPAQDAAVVSVATKVDGPLTVGCRWIESVDASPWIEFACDTAEAADKLAERLPVVARGALASDGAAPTIVVRVPVSAFARLEAGGGG